MKPKKIKPAYVYPQDFLDKIKNPRFDLTNYTFSINEEDYIVGPDMVGRYKMIPKYNGVVVNTTGFDSYWYRDPFSNYVAASYLYFPIWNLKLIEPGFNEVLNVNSGFFSKYFRAHIQEQEKNLKDTIKKIRASEEYKEKTSVALKDKFRPYISDFIAKLNKAGYTTEEAEELIKRTINQAIFQKLLT